MTKRLALAGATVVGKGIRQRRARLSAEHAEQLGRPVVWAGERYLHKQTCETPPSADRLVAESLTEIIWRVVQP